MIEIHSASLHPPVIKTRSLRGAVRHMLHKEPAQTYDILTDITLDLSPGTRLGLLGSNGAGKTSLLRMMAGIYAPTSGTIRREGKTVTLFDLQFGMDEEASGYKNLQIAGALLGIPRKKILDLTPEIAEFSELGEAMERPIKSYSSGMRVRLAFSLVTTIQADIFLIDEIIGVGDASFLDKARDRMRQYVADARVLVLASHANNVLQEFCTTGAVMAQGRILFHGPIDDAVAYYQEYLDAQP